MLNTCLTVRAHSAGSHQGKGWEQFTDRVIETVDRYGGANLGKKSGVGRGVVFLAWGAWAAKRVAKLSKVRACGSRALDPQRRSALPLLSSSPIPRPLPPLNPSLFFCSLHLLQADTSIQFFFLFLFHLISFIVIDRVLISNYQNKHLILSSAVSLSVVPPRRRVLMIGARAL